MRAVRLVSRNVCLHGSGVANKTGHARRAVSAGRRHRRHRAHRAGAPREATRPAGSHREPGRGRRLDRHGRGGKGGARWPDAALHPVLAHYQPGHLSRPAVRYRARFQRHHAGRVIAAALRGEFRYAFPELPRAGRLYQGESAQARLWFRRRRLAQPHGGGAARRSHMAGELLKLQLDADMVHVPYRGGGPAVAAAMAGDVPLLIVSIPAAMGQVRSGRLRALAVSTAKRTPILPEVPTVAEATGLKKFEVDSWYAVFAPVKTPGEVIERSNRELATVLARTDVKAKLLEQGAEAAPSTPQALTRRVHREIAEWQALVKRVPIEAD